jgi:plasmid stabilization system protein ParE
MKSFSLNEDAIAELYEAGVHYESEREGLGIQFVTAVREDIDFICQFPEAMQRIRRDVRRKVMSRFPYNIIYKILPDKIRVLAVAHQKRRPLYWANRT